MGENIKCKYLLPLAILAASVLFQGCKEDAFNPEKVKAAYQDSSSAATRATWTRSANIKNPLEKSKEKVIAMLSSTEEISPNIDFQTEKSTTKTYI